MDPEDILALIAGLESIESSSSSDDEETLLIAAIVDEVFDTETHAKIRDYVDNVVSQYSDSDFKKHFRMERATVSALTEMFERSIFCPPSERMQGGGTKIFPSEDYLLVFLWFAGNKATYRDVADRFGIVESTVFKIINVVMDFLNDVAPTFFHFPRTTASKRALADEFYQLAGFPDVIGCVDGSYINTNKPAHKIRSTYINRHDQVSVTLQGISDARKRFLDVFTGVPSKVHDARVFRLSSISNNIENICERTFHLLGDGAYELREWILKPYRDYELTSRARRRYNRRFCATRVVIENAFGILKKRFIQLIRLYMWDVDRITKFIISCCVLHNICIDENDDVPSDGNIESDDSEDGESSSIESDNEDGLTARQLRQRGDIKRNDICALLQ